MKIVQTYLSIISTIFFIYKHRVNLADASKEKPQKKFNIKNSAGLIQQSSYRVIKDPSNDKNNLTGKDKNKLKTDNPNELKKGSSLDMQNNNSYNIGDKKIISLGKSNRKIDLNEMKVTYDDPDVVNARKALLYFYFTKMKKDKKMEFNFIKNQSENSNPNAEVEKIKNNFLNAGNFFYLNFR